MSFYLSKTIWVLLNPFNIFILFTISTIILYLISFRKISITIFLINSLYLILISFFPVGDYLIYKIEKEYHSNINIPDKLDGILILGGATNPSMYKEFNQISVNDSAERLIESVSIINRFKSSKVIFSGGSGVVNRPDLGHSQVAKLFYEKIGMGESRIIFEDNSRNTYENILFSKKIANPQKNQSWLLITSASHMKRAMLIGSKHNWHLIPYAVDFKTMKILKFIPNLNLLYNLNAFQQASYEWLGLISYYLMGRTNKIF
tara:strand:+ start:20 stop:802 length:783 start_codon:yes stop_codon:yes gene_type:complete